MLKDHYLEGEERFGPVSSRIYEIGSCLPSIRNFYRFVAGDLKKSGAKVLLDIGCGPAAVPIMLSGSANSKIYCVDLSEDMVKIARRNAKPYKNVKIGFGSSRSIPFRMKFDIVYTSLSFHHWHEKAQSLNYMKGFLTKNGEIRIYEFKRDGSRLLGLLGLGCHTLDMPELRRISSQVGLEIAGVVYMGRYVRVSLTDKYKFLKKKIK